MAGEEVSLTPHDHFGIPAGLPATITARGGDPLVLLDATLERTAAFPGSQPASRPA
jgi:hypothetical protein